MSLADYYPAEEVYRNGFYFQVWDLATDDLYVVFGCGSSRKEG
jgi:hypothetical protein